YRLSPRLKELAKWTKLANNGARWALLNTRDEVVAWGRYLSDYTLCSCLYTHLRAHETLTRISYGVFCL
ncbi:hypothetical protein ACVGWD_08200, partial [Enterobacter asburiae]